MAVKLPDTFYACGRMCNAHLVDDRPRRRHALPLSLQSSATSLSSFSLPREVRAAQMGSPVNQNRLRTALGIT
jgi:hypothetical protein